MNQFFAIINDGVRRQLLVSKSIRVRWTQAVTVEVDDGFDPFNLPVHEVIGEIVGFCDRTELAIGVKVKKGGKAEVYWIASSDFAAIAEMELDLSGV